jgi:hypothetical protein
VNGSLADTQRRLWRLIAWPEGVRPALREEGPDTPPIESVVRSDERLGAEDRLDVYANAYFYRIHDVLAADCPLLAEALGEEGFHDLVTSYLAVHPSRHPSLRYIGDRLPDFLRGHDAARSLREGCPWSPDLAVFEQACETVFDAADTHAATHDDLAALPPEDWDGLVLRLRPSVVLLRLDWSVHDLRPGKDGQRAADSAPEAQNVAVCVWRRDERVLHRALEPGEARALERAVEGVAFGSLCEEIARETGEDEAPSRAAAWLARWTGDGLLLA